MTQKQILRDKRRHFPEIVCWETGGAAASLLAGFLAGSGVTPDIDCWLIKWDFYLFRGFCGRWAEALSDWLESSTSVLNCVDCSGAHFSRNMMVFIAADPVIGKTNFRQARHLQQIIAVSQISNCPQMSAAARAGSNSQFCAYKKNRFNISIALLQPYPIILLSFTAQLGIFFVQKMILHKERSI